MIKMKTAIEIKNITKEFKEKKGLPSWMSLSRKKLKKRFKAINNINLEIKSGEIFGILGPNGCGKSTLIRMISTLLIPDQGSIKVFGVDVVKEPHLVKQMINRVSAEASFIKSLSAQENLTYAARLYGLSARQAKQRSAMILQELGFPMKKLKEKIENFSRGLQQKTAIARSFLSTPMLLLLDEPTTGLDPKSKLEVTKLIKKIKQQRDITIILTSHDMEEIDRLCNRIAIMDNGIIIAFGTPNELKDLVRNGRRHSLKTCNPKKTVELLHEIKEIRNIKLEGTIISFGTKDIDKVIGEILSKIQKNKIKFINLEEQKPTLEDVFLKLTGKHIEDDVEE